MAGLFCIPAKIVQRSAPGTKCGKMRNFLAAPAAKGGKVFGNVHERILHHILCGRRTHDLFGFVENQAVIAFVIPEKSLLIFLVFQKCQTCC